MDLTPTPSQTVGPFFAVGLTREKSCVRQIAESKASGERVVLICRVFDGDAVPVPDAMVEIWQADAHGKYHGYGDPRFKTRDPARNGFGRMGTNEQGSCEFETIKPGRVPGPGGALQAPHLSVALFARGLLTQLYTRIYFANDPANREDPILALVPEERRGTLMAHLDTATANCWKSEIHLQGERETVFFDV